MGFKHGTANPSIHDAKAMDRFVWVGDEGPDWMHGGSYVVLRRIRIALEHWDRRPPEFQEQSVGRHKNSGAPLGRDHEFDPPDLTATRNDGDLLIPESTHIRLATAGSNEGAQILRRPYSSTMGLISPLSAGRPGAGVWSTTPGCCSYAINAIMGERIVRFCRRLRSHSIGRGDARRPQLLRSQAPSNGSSLKARGSGGRCR
jgi:Dyp-type peroxidase family